MMHPSRSLPACLALIAGLASASAARADSVLMENGDRLTGKVLQVSDGKLSLETEQTVSIRLEDDHTIHCTTLALALGTPQTDAGNPLAFPLSLGEPPQAVGPDGRILPVGAESSAGVQWSRSSGPLSFSLSAQGRICFPSGAAGDAYYEIGGNLYYDSEHLRYEDLFDTGFGAALEADLLYRLGGQTGGGARMGAYVSLQGSWFEGDTATDRFGNRISPDDLALGTLLAGFKSAMPLGGPLFGEVRIGFGATRYEEVQADLRTSGGTRTRTVLLEECTRFTMETGVAVGLQLGSFAVKLGFDTRSVEGAATEVNSARFDPHTLWIFDLNLGVGIGF